MALVFMIALAAPAAAEECQISTADPDVNARVTQNAALYIDLECWESSCPDIIAIWIYTESNGLEGLQRDDEVRDDTCGGRIEPDTRIL